MDEPVAALLGAIFIAFGLIVSYGALRNKRVFGKGGILPTAITTGALTDLDKVPNAFPSFSLTPSTPTPGVVDSVIDTISDFWPKQMRALVGQFDEAWTPPNDVIEALANMTKDQPYYGGRLTIEVYKLRNFEPGDNLQLIRILLDGFRNKWNHASDADTVADFVKEVTNESV